MERLRRRVACVAPLALLAACTEPPLAAPPPARAFVEPEVFDVIRASNSKEAVEQLRDQYHSEVEHARLLEARIGELIAAEEALSAEQRQRLESLQKIRDQVRSLADQNAALEKQLNAELARNEELKKKLEQAKGGAAAAPGQEPVAPKKEAPAPKGGADAKKDGAGG